MAINNNERPIQLGARRLFETKEVKEYQAIPVKDDDSLSKHLWFDNSDIANTVLSSNFIQGIKKGNLDAISYVYLSIQDALYCQNGMQDYSDAMLRSSGDIFQFLQARLKGYQTYVQQVLNQLSMYDTNSIVASDSANMYSKFESYIAQNLKPIYLVVAMIPCDKLWWWLATQIQGSINPSNPYNDWIKNNLSNGYQKLDSFIDNNSSSIDTECASTIYRNCMLGEYNFFQKACGQPTTKFAQLPNTCK